MDVLFCQGANSVPITGAPRVGTRLAQRVGRFHQPPEWQSKISRGPLSMAVLHPGEREASTPTSVLSVPAERASRKRRGIIDPFGQGTV
jgi:hypothetical protein